MQVEYNTRSSDMQSFGRGGKTQDGRKYNAQNLSQEDRAKGGRNSAKSRGGQGKGRSNYGDDNDYGDENYDTSNQYRGKSKGQQDGRKFNAQNLSQEDRAKGGRNSAKSRASQGQQRHYGHDHDYDEDNRGKGQDGRKKNAQNLSQEDRARGGRNSRKSSGDYDNTQYFGTSKVRTSPKNQDQGSKTMPNYARELDELLEDASNFLDQPIPDKVKDNLHYEDGETEDEISGSGVEEMMGGESEPDQAEMDTQKKTYFTEYPKNKNRGQGQGRGQGRGQGQGQDGRRKNAQNLSQEDRARGGRHSGKSKRQQDYGNEDEDEEDYDEDDYQGRGKGQDRRRKNAQNLSQEDRVKGGIESGKSRRGEKQGDYGNEDEDEEDYDEDDYQGRGKQGRGFGPGGVSGHVLTQEERARGGRHSAKSRRQGNSDNEDEDEEDYDEDDNQGRGKQGRGKQGRGFGPGGVTGHVLTQEERARGGRHSAKSRRGQKQGDYDNKDEDEEDYDEDDYQSRGKQGRGKQGKGYGPGGVTGHVLTQEERARGGRHSAKSRRPGKSDNEDEDEEDYDDDNQGRGKRGKGYGPGGVTGYVLSQEERARGGRYSAKSRRQRNYGNEDEDEEDYDEDDYQGRGKQGRGYGPGGVSGHVLTQEERARGGRHSVKSRRQGKSDNEDEDEEDYDEDDYQGRGKQGRGNQGKGYGPGGVSGHVLTQEERARGGRHSAKSKRQGNYDNDDEDEPPVQKKRQLQLGKAY